MEQFIIQENIHRYEHMLKQENAPERKATLEALLEAEKAKLAAVIMRAERPNA